MPSFRVAIIADAHFHDPQGDFGGAGMDLAGERLVLRSWADTRSAIRAVNESAAALTAALDRIVAMGLTHVILAGDYTDDGQAETTRRLAALLHRYQDDHGLRFHAIPGNHDVYASHGKHISARILTAPGQTALLTSDPALGQNPDGITTPAMRCLGQPQGLAPMAAFGLYRQDWHHHWETPFGPDDAPTSRMYDATAADGSVTHRLMDASYLVEPEPGLWLLMLDANVFEPRPGRSDPTRKQAFLDPSEAGWNALPRVKPHLLSWIADVTARAMARGKALLTVSHYPVLDPFLTVAGTERALAPHSALALRTPRPDVAWALIAAGLRWHAGGHLHVHATNTLTHSGATLTDVALPSLVTFPPAFTLITATDQPRSAGATEPPLPSGERAGVRGQNPASWHITAETLTLADLPPDPMLTAIYAAEGRTETAQTYGHFLADQFRTRVREVRLPRDWPPDTLVWTAGRTVADLVAVLALPQGGLSADDLACPLIDLAADLYLLRDGGALAPAHLPPARLHLCRTLVCHGDSGADPAKGIEAFWRRFLSIVGA